jgi:hypothetical protein
MRKSEYRNSKSETNSNDQSTKFKTQDAAEGVVVLDIWILDFEIVSDLDIRISDFVCQMFVPSSTCLTEWL